MVAGGSAAGSANPIADGSMELRFLPMTAAADCHRSPQICPSSEVIVYKKRCSSVLRNPQAYENDIVQICKLIN